jgi:predicted enzyme related to lactoylglutathione lyase
VSASGALDLDLSSSDCVPWPRLVAWLQPKDSFKGILTMSNAEIRGRFIWHELVTPDPAAAAAFYSKVVPWKAQPSAQPSYMLWMAGKTGTGGLVALPAEEEAAGRAPHWLVYIGTPDVDATVQEAERLGATVMKAPENVPEVGRYAVLTDPQGAQFAVFTPSGGPAAGAGASGTAGEFSWHELATTDPEGATDFYVQLFGWEKGPAHDLGEMGSYHILEQGGAQIGGIHRVRPGSPPRWLSYVRVMDADQAADDAREAGGRVLNGPVEVPDGSWIVMLLDPQGGAFAVHEPAVKAKPVRKVARTGRSRPTEAVPPARAVAAEQPKPAVTSEPVSPPPVAPVPAKAPVKRAKAPVKSAPLKPAPVKRPAAKSPPAPVEAAPAKGGRKAAGKKAARVKLAARKPVARPAPKPAARPVAKKKTPVRPVAAKRGRGSASVGRAPSRAVAKKVVRGKRR